MYTFSRQTLGLFRDEINQLFAPGQPLFEGAPKWKGKPNQLAPAVKRLKAEERYAIASDVQGAIEVVSRLVERENLEDDEVTGALELLVDVREHLLGAKLPE